LRDLPGGPEIRKWLRQTYSETERESPAALRGRSVGRLQAAHQPRTRRPEPSKRPSSPSAPR